MELEQLFDTWKMQDQYPHISLQKGTLSELLKQKSKGALDQIANRLTVELAVIIGVGIGFNVLYFIVALPYSLVRWTCFTIFNLTALTIILVYPQTIIASKNALKEDLATSLAKIIASLKSYQKKSRFLQLPIGIICILTFAGAQQLLYWLPWMIIEFCLWKWSFGPKMNKRFENYLSELEYAFKSLKDLE